MPNPFSLIDRLEIDFELPPAPGPLARADQWFNRLSELQRIGVALLIMMFLAASAFYCLGLGSTVLVNRAEAELAVMEAELAASIPTVELTPTAPEPTATQVVIPTEVPTLRPTARPTQVVDYPTPIPAQLVPTVPLVPAQRAVAPAQAAPPRLVAPVEPPTPTPPNRAPAPAAKPNTSSNGTTVRTGTPAPALAPPAAKPAVVTPGTGTTRPAATAAPAITVPASKPSQPSTGQPAVKPTTAPVINPFPNKPVIPASTAVPKPSAR